MQAVLALPQLLLQLLLPVHRLGALLRAQQRQLSVWLLAVIHAGN